METKSTAVEWLFEKITQNAEIRWRGTQYVELFQQAKVMEKEQIKDAYDEGDGNGTASEWGYERISSEKYYEETYGK